jgi:hypothetical protein
MKRILGPILLAILILGVGAGIFFAVRQVVVARRVLTVRGLIGSEKGPFFRDPRVIEALRKGGLNVVVEEVGSRQIATSYNLAEYDFAFPAGVPAAEKMRRVQSGSRSYDVFFTPMAIASWQPIAQLLVENGIAQDRGGYYTLDVARYLDLVGRGQRWSDLASNTAYPVSKRILITSTDVRRSNSAAMYLSLASYVANGNRVVQNDAEADAILRLLSSLFLEQGFQASSSQEPFQDYQVMGIGKSPMVMIYEAQFIGAASTTGLHPEMVLIYPEPTILSKHVLVAFSEGGQRLGELLRDDPRLQDLAVEFGFRTNDPVGFSELLARLKLPLPGSIVNVIDPPSYEVLEGMIEEIEAQF